MMGLQATGLGMTSSKPIMRKMIFLFVALVLAATILTAGPMRAQKDAAKSPRILSAKTVFWDDQTGARAVGGAALDELKKWGRFQIVTDQGHADLILLLSADPFHGGSIILANGQTGSIDADGNITKDPVPNPNKAAPVRDAYLTVVDRASGEKLWSDSHVWGGLLTGKSSAGERLVKELEKQVEK